MGTRQGCLAGAGAEQREAPRRPGAQVTRNGRMLATYFGCGILHPSIEDVPPDGRRAAWGGIGP